MGNSCCIEDEDNISNIEKVDNEASKQLKEKIYINKKTNEIISKNSRELNNEEKNNKINLYNKNINIEKKSDGKKMSKETIDVEITNGIIKLNNKKVDTKKIEDQIKISNLQKDNNKKENKDIKISNELFNKEIKIDGFFGIETIINEEKKEVCSQNKSNQNSPQKIEIKESNNFPLDSKYEKELNSNFKYFNVFWFDPDKTNDYNLFEKCFENVQFLQAHDINSVINFFEKETILEWIIISNGTQIKELVQNLENNNCIKSVFIYCPNK